MKEILVYSTAAGEIPKMVREGKAMCFVSYTDYIELKRQFDELSVAAEKQNDDV